MAPSLMRRALCLEVSLSLLLVGSVAWSGDLSLATLEHGPWPEAVAALQRDLQGEGRAVRVVVLQQDGARVPCGAYALTLDAVGQEAFRLGACDPSTHATEVRLVRRGALFAHDDLVPRPLLAGITAVQVRTGGARGGAASGAGASVACSVAVRPFLYDMEHGTRVYLQPGRFVLQPRGAGISAEASTEGWTMRSAARVDLTVDYDVIDTQRAQLVLRGRATLSCGSAEAPASESSVGGGPAPVVPAALPEEDVVVIRRVSITVDRGRSAVVYGGPLVVRRRPPQL